VTGRARIGVGVVSFNTRELLARCLESVAAEAPDTVVVIDNASTDGSAEVVVSNFPAATVVANKANRGYGAAANQAVAACDTPYVLVLNGDTRLLPGALRALSDHLDDHPAAGVAGPRLLNSDGTPQVSCFAFPTPFQTVLRTTFVGALATRLPGIGDRYRYGYEPDVPSPVPWLLGAALAVRRAAFDTVGGFDEEFFMYSEEVDLCYRLAAAGWETHFTPLAQIVHAGGGSTRQLLVEMEARRYAETRRFYRKHYSPAAYRLLIGLTIYRMLHNLARDTLRLLLTRHDGKRAGIAQELVVWRRVLRGAWKA
jgi:N-acetylglucosaminyl-diphospho-decaprenol L-rhamnosyltransferase